MYLVVIHHHENSAENAQALATVLGVTAYDARQRLVCSGPIVVATLAAQDQAKAFLARLRSAGFDAFSIDTEAAHNQRSSFVVRSFAFNDDRLAVLEAGTRKASAAYRDIRLILPVTQSTIHTETQTVTEKKLSLGKTVMMGGLPMTKKVTRQETITTDEREHVLYLCGANGARLICSRSGMNYAGFAGEMQASRDLNFNLFCARIRQKCPAAVYDDRLLKRAEQVKLLGPTLNPERNIDLAVDILISALLPDRAAE